MTFHDSDSHLPIRQWKRQSELADLDSAMTYGEKARNSGNLDTWWNALDRLASHNPDPGFRKQLGIWFAAGYAQQH